MQHGGLEVGDGIVGDEVRYPDDDLKAVRVDKSSQFMHKDRRPH